MSIRTFLSLSLLSLWAPHLLGDVLHLQDGRRVKGTFLGGDARTVQFVPQGGDVHSYPVADIRRLLFGHRQDQRLQTLTPVDEISRDTVLVVRMMDAVNSDKNEVGDTFRAHLEKDVMAHDRLLIPRNSPATVQLAAVKQSGKLKGREEIALRLHSLSLNGRLHSVDSDWAELVSDGKGKQSAAVIGGASAVGGLLGALTGGKKGVVIGAAVGAAAGTTVQLLRGKRVEVPAETVLSFRLRESMRIPASGTASTGSGLPALRTSGEPHPDPDLELRPRETRGDDYAFSERDERLIRD